MTDLPVPDPLPIGYRLHDRYLIEAELPAQQMGRAYRALDTVLNERVAISVLSPEFRQGRALMRFRLLFKRAFYRNRGHVYDYGECQGVPYVVVEYVDGVGAAVDVADG